MDKKQSIEALKQKFINILLQMDEVAPVVFEDGDGYLLHFYNVEYDEDEDKCVIQLSWNKDNLPITDKSAQNKYKSCCDRTMSKDRREILYGGDMK